MKAGPGKDLQLIDGAGVAAALAELNLIDEYQVVVHPVVLGGGKQLFPLVPRFGVKLSEGKLDGRNLFSGHLKVW